MKQRPKNWQKALNSSQFKTALLKFLSQEWATHADASVLDGHHVYLAIEDVCHHFTVQAGRVVHEEVPELASKHEEADTRIVYHLASLFENEKPSVAVRCSDTDVLVLLLHHILRITDQSSVWMDVGLSANNTRRYINVTQMAEHIDDDVLDALPALHAFTGTDFTAAFMNKGKMRPLDIMMKSQRFTRAFACLGRGSDISESILEDIEKFTCSLYGSPRLSNVNDVRLAQFEQKYSPRDASHQPLDKIRGISPHNMPPCHSVLVNKVRRANYVAYTWKNASQKNPCDLKPEDHGWLLQDNYYVINWYDGDQLPESILNIISDDTDPQVDDADEEMPLCSSDESDDSDDEY